MLTGLILGFILGAYIECKYCTKIETVVALVLGTLHKVIGLVVNGAVGIWNAVKAIFTKKPEAVVEAAPVEAAPVAPTPDAAPAAPVAQDPAQPTPPAAQ
jgi:hypothetical protein